MIQFVLNPMCVVQILREPEPKRQRITADSSDGSSRAAPETEAQSTTNDQDEEEAKQGDAPESQAQVIENGGVAEAAVVVCTSTAQNTNTRSDVKTFQSNFDFVYDNEEDEAVYDSIIAEMEAEYQ